MKKGRVVFKPRVKVEQSPIAVYMKKERAEVNRLNKQRARTMENEVAKFLGGFRVPMSGAGSLKGDVFARTADGDLVLIECKITSRELAYGPVFFLHADYLEGLVKDAASMAAPYPALAFRYLGDSTLYFCVFEDTFVALGGDLKTVPFVECSVFRHSVHKVLADSLPKPFRIRIDVYSVVIVDQFSFLQMLGGTYGK